MLIQVIVRSQNIKVKRMRKTKEERRRRSGKKKKAKAPTAALTFFFSRRLPSFFLLSIAACRLAKTPFSTSFSDHLFALFPLLILPWSDKSTMSYVEADGKTWVRRELLVSSSMFFPSFVRKKEANKEKKNERRCSTRAFFFLLSLRM